ncbi:hypothetical protein [Chryseobacterium piperi]|nr:hypothetical protein [Chryseobacterium piperi]
MSKEKNGKGKTAPMKTAKEKRADKVLKRNVKEEVDEKQNVKKP